MGATDGMDDGKSVDPWKGWNEGFAVVGITVGTGVGIGDGALLGHVDGLAVGPWLG